MMKNHVYLAAAISLSCATEPPAAPEEHEAGGIPAVAIAEPDPMRAPIPTPEEIDARIAERMALAAAAASAPTGNEMSTPGAMPTAVQQADGFYSDCYSELRARRLACRRRFNRRLSETALMERMGSDAELPNLTRLVLGRIILSEANWPHDERRDRYFPEQNHAEIDAPAIYQVLRHTRRSGETLLGAMRRHAPHVSEARAITGRLLERRMAWVTRLQLSCNRPNGFPEADRQGNPISWDDDGYRERCESLFVLAGRLLDGDSDALGAWTSAPVITWGGRCEDPEGACDDHLASHRGLVPFEATSGPPTANRFWCRPGVAGCDGAPLELDPRWQAEAN